MSETTTEQPTVNEEAATPVTAESDAIELTVELTAALEALLIVSDQGQTAEELATIVGRPVDEVDATLTELSQQYEQQGRGFELRAIDGAWRFYSARSCADVITRYVTEGKSGRLSQAALETLAVVAYKQPVSRARVGAIRGVNVDGVMRTLIARGLVTETGTDPSSLALLYGTTSYFLERMGISSLDELPPVADHLPDLSVLDEFIDSEV